LTIDRSSWEKLQNDVEMIKTRVSSLDRIAVLQNKGLIVQDLAEVVGKSTYIAAVLHLTRDEIPRRDLARALGSDDRNLNKFTNPLIGNKGYLNEFRRGGTVSYRRDEKMDLIDYDNTEPFKTLIAKWAAHRNSQG
jgi:hypothetical protein